MPGSTAEPTATLQMPRTDLTVSFVPERIEQRSAFEEELRQLLRSRLVLVHLLYLGSYSFLALLLIFAPNPVRSTPRPGYDLSWLPLPALLAECLIGAIVLWRRKEMSLRSLRLWELLFFGLHGAINGYVRFADLARIVEIAPRELTLTFAFVGLYSLQSFVILMLAYGVLIPNTFRRSILVIASLAAVPLLAIPAAAAVNPILRGLQPLLPMVLQWALTLLVPGGIAIFAATRLAALQRRAFNAERRAERMGQYSLKRKLGQGGMGEVWLAEHTLLKRPCAVKLIHPDSVNHPDTATRFAREVRAVTGLTHANTVRVYDYGRTEDGSFYYVMEYLDGPTLEDLVRQSGPLPPGRVVYLLRQVCGALAEAHSEGLVHRDLKPGNIIIARLGGQRDVSKLLDFGLVQDLTAGSDERLTRTGTVLGTPAYMSPEQASGESAVDARGDIYSLGAVAFFALTGRPPFLGKNLGQLLAAHRSELPPLLTDIQSDMPADLAAVVGRCLAKDPIDRFSTAVDLDSSLAKCSCADEWSAALAATWWQTKSGQEEASS